MKILNLIFNPILNQDQWKPSQKQCWKKRGISYSRRGDLTRILMMMSLSNDRQRRKERRRLRMIWSSTLMSLLP